MTNKTWTMVTSKGSEFDQFGRALWNALAPLHGEPPCYAPNEQPCPALDLADTDVITHLLPHTNLPSANKICERCYGAGSRYPYPSHFNDVCRMCRGSGKEPTT